MTELLIDGQKVELPDEVARRYLKMELALSKARDMRSTQRAYFKDRKHSDLTGAKRLEAELDSMLEQLNPTRNGDRLI